MILRSFCHHLEIILPSYWDHVGIISALFPHDVGNADFYTWNSHIGNLGLFEQFDQVAIGQRHPRREHDPNLAEYEGTFI